MSSQRRFSRDALSLAVGVLAIVVLPFLVSDFRSSQLAFVAVYFVALLGLDVIAGQAGQLSLGQGAFMAVGGYTTCILVVDHGIRDVWTIPLAGLVAAGAGAAAAVPAARLSGIYLALATLALAVTVPAIVKEVPGLTGGGRGLQLFGLDAYTGKGFEPVHLGGVSLSFNHWLYLLAWGCAVALVVPAWLLRRSRLGLRLRAVRDNELAATVAGLRPTTLKTLAFAIGAAYAGVAGSLLGIVSSFVSPESFSVTLSLLLVVGLVIGGSGSIAGLLVGAGLIQFLPDLAQNLSKRPGVPSVVYGAAVVLAALLLPSGVGGALRALGSLLGPGPADERV